ncbi:gamma-glutamyl-gamma-aminobutyrate hydrolase family protein [Evansella tamaricis]|uniref:Gamma-glutamyl-gamma-aminobutyrate hydrolase family protein n=1 Tax=Evansella tamaricis TaxID=2069301 RepID=A0ABS6JJW2_9BACI|nr:gamma-glutamyl-gamma-aminobutyrate hydrolase family protein [Evansella tamaricis]MBU9713876.1 gamma-glutamyl-gamma-aminobutyrate hydrolase family protein [Evansella tamaricis]
MKKPMIGVLPLYDKDKESYWMLPGYMKGIELAGGIPVMLPLTTDRDLIMTLAKTYDGFLFTGGQDVNPELYGEKVEEFCGELCHERDTMEKFLFHQAVLLDKPMFGICRGIQLFNTLLGGTLYQDIPLQFSKMVGHKQNAPYDKPVHHVSIDNESLLSKLLNLRSMMVNSYHHQGIHELSDQLVCNARAEDGLVEAVHMPGKRFVLAVQWHPEFNYETDQANFKLFQEFVCACGTPMVPEILY